MRNYSQGEVESGSKKLLPWGSRCKCGGGFQQKRNQGKELGRWAGVYEHTQCAIDWRLSLLIAYSLWLHCASLSWMIITLSHTFLLTRQYDRNTRCMEAKGNRQNVQRWRTDYTFSVQNSAPCGWHMGTRTAQSRGTRWKHDRVTRQVTSWTGEVESPWWPAQDWDPGKRNLTRWRQTWISAL